MGQAQSDITWLRERGDMQKSDVSDKGAWNPSNLAWLQYLIASKFCV